MANVLKHRFVSVKADGADATQVQPSNWNDGHAFSGGAAGDVLTRDPTDAAFGAIWAPPAVALPPGGNDADILTKDLTVPTYAAKWAPPAPAAPASVYTPYAPAWGSTGTQPVLGDGTLNGRWWRNDHTVFFAINFLIGSTSGLGTGQWYFTLPVPAESAGSISMFGTGIVTDASAGNAAYPLLLGLDSSGSNSLFIPWNGIFTVGGGNTLTPTVPIAFAAGDRIRMNGFYFAAPLTVADIRQGDR
jgi:hypothetical protein